FAIVMFAWEKIPLSITAMVVAVGLHLSGVLSAKEAFAGFPSPATDYAEQELDLNSYCISRPAATFFLRTSGESMNQA
ncbi:Protein impA, partial [human gut metagenome]